MPLTPPQIDRYSRHILLPEVGSKGQEALLNAKVLYIGAGGLGCPALQYLAAAGVGTLGIMDDDVVELSNLARQILYTQQDIGRQKAVVASEKLHRLNPDVRCIPYPTRFGEEHAALLNEYDIIADGSDNFVTRLLLNKLCFTHNKPLVSAAVTGFGVQVMTFKPYLNNEYPCYQCLYGATPAEANTGNCAENGVLSPVAGIAGTLQATAIIQEILGLGESGKTLFTFDTLTFRGHTIEIAKDPVCAVCG
jgi:adenylyltransferase/sulfurtransferase